MKLTIKYANYTKVIDGLVSMDDVNDKILDFFNDNGLTDACWPTFVLEGECNVKKKVIYHEGMDCLFG